MISIILFVIGIDQYSELSQFIDLPLSYARDNESVEFELYRWAERFLKNSPVVEAEIL